MHTWKKTKNAQTLTHQVPELMNANSCVDLILDSLNLRTQQETSHTERHMDCTHTHTHAQWLVLKAKGPSLCVSSKQTYQSVRVGLTTDNRAGDNQSIINVFESTREEISWCQEDLSRDLRKQRVYLQRCLQRFLAVCIWACWCLCGTDVISQYLLITDIGVYVARNQLWCSKCANKSYIYEIL